MSSDHQTQPGQGNGADYAGGPGAQIVEAAVAALLALGGGTTSDAIDGIMKDAVYAGGTSIERDLIWHRVGEHLTAMGLKNQSFTRNWSRLEKELREEEREEQRKAKGNGTEPELTDDEILQLREELYPRVKPLLDHPDILNAVADAVDTLGAAGVRAETKALYLAGVSALSLQPLSIDVHGPSSIGKSYLVRKVLRLFPGGAVYEFTTASAKVFFYDREDALKHKIVYAGEATAFYANQDGDDSSTQAAALLRQLQSDGSITHRVTLKNESGELEAKTITREGPISLIVTSTQELHAENATRNLILHLSETAEQTRTIIDKRMMMRINPDVAGAVDLSVWHDLHVYLSYGPTHCVVPYARTLGRLIDEHHLRIRRDVDAIVSAIEAHTLLNQKRREQDARGRWVAVLDDYAAIQPIFDTILAHGREDVLGEGSRRLHTHVVTRIKQQEAAREQESGAAKRPRPLRRAAGSDIPTETITITVRQLAADLGAGKSAIGRQLKELYDLQLIKNMETRARQPLRLRVLAPLSDQKTISVLPSPDDLATIWNEDCTHEQTLSHGGSGTIRTGDSEEKGQSQTASLCPTDVWDSAGQRPTVPPVPNDPGTDKCL
jgi:hypothetical protein